MSSLPRVLHVNSRCSSHGVSEKMKRIDTQILGYPLKTMTMTDYQITKMIKILKDPATSLYWNVPKLHSFCSFGLLDMPGLKWHIMCRWLDDFCMGHDMTWHDHFLRWCHARGGCLWFWPPVAARTRSGEITHLFTKCALAAADSETDERLGILEVENA